MRKPGWGDYAGSALVLGALLLWYRFHVENGVERGYGFGPDWECIGAAYAPVCFKKR